MKKFYILALYTTMITSAQAQNNKESIFDYTVYAKETINAECSDFLGRTAAGSTIKLRDFLIKLPSGDSGCAIECNRDVEMIRGKVAIGQAPSCVAAKTFNAYDTDAGSLWRNQTNFVALNEQLNNLSKTLSQPIANIGVKQITIDINQVKNKGYFLLNGSSNELLVINIYSTDVIINGFGVILNGNYLHKILFGIFQTQKPFQSNIQATKTTDFQEHL